MSFEPITEGRDVTALWQDRSRLPVRLYRADVRMTRMKPRDSSWHQKSRFPRTLGSSTGNRSRTTRLTAQ